MRHKLFHKHGICRLTIRALQYSIVQSIANRMEPSYGNVFIKTNEILNEMQHIIAVSYEHNIEHNGLLFEHCSKAY